MISTLLVANRGEIARRVFRTCARLGIERVAVFSDADSSAPHVAEADAAVRLPGNTPAETYLRTEALIAAATAAGADAVHPGYGFLSENAAFARAVLDAGLTWVGPSPESIEAMGSKVTAKRISSRAGVPVLSGLDPAEVTEDDLPVLVKASAGGGGRGMRVVRSFDELAAAVDSARAEAASAFGDETVFCERYLETGRHIEVQIVADGHGTVWALGERECSIQRRHQKVIEEAPSPAVGHRLREELFEAARKAAKAIDYVGAGTVEFLVTSDGRFFFLEMNTRLQVEHPVTECVTGVDLVELQLAIAEGNRLPLEPPASNGHAIEVRLYAEDPAAGWQPQTGTLHRFSVPGDVRVDSGVVDGSVIGVHYDPMLAKVIAWAPDRATAARKLATALAGATIHGPRTNRDLLVNVLRHKAFRAGEIDTGFFERHGLDTLARPLGDPRLAAIVAALADAAADRGSGPGAWRNVWSAPQRRMYTVDGVEHEVAYTYQRSGVVVNAPDLDAEVQVVQTSPGQVVLEVAGVRRTFEVGRYPGLVCVGPVALTPVPRFTEPGAALAAGSLVAPMPGTVLRVAVAAGDRVEAGDTLLWLEAMKMEHKVSAPAGGVVAELPVTVGQQVDVGAVLAVVRPVEESEERP
ncbi:acetyl/propionyl/methylcrotonyl-CoA carboxylase subunit alpha [Amycolatopsis taiwanensis]|uniref:Acetyl/propionyl-CoA carboxylase subuit alpha n=1 Tax=Amycolatopsis taiwanensis TaxID=342230 RepID=A0A9W6QXG6_9PSEU|nr:biotin carboxylase N-terminal domain-containing protein [Amycolatopsis taiwanensis]GLY65824.1 acetyl/propionyl-CoA carboxylase subuit alpha [Amycolatopsis taiwanensis]